MEKRTKLKIFMLDNIIWVMVILFFAVNAIFTNKFVSYKNILNLLNHSAIVSMLILGQGIVMITGELDLSLESILVFSTGCAILLSNALGGLNPYICIILTLAIGGLIGAFNGFCVSKLRINSFLQTLSVEIILRGLVLYLIPFSLTKLDPVYTFVGKARTFGNIPVAVLVTIAIFIVFEFVFRKTTFGRKFMLTGGNRRAAYISGINTERIGIWAFTIAGVLASVAGLIMAGRQSTVSNTMGQDLGMTSFAGAILGGASFAGGIGTPIGMLGGSILLGMIDNSLNLLGINVSLVYATKGALIFIAIVLDRFKLNLKANILQKDNLRQLTANSPAE